MKPSIVILLSIMLSLSGCSVFKKSASGAKDVVGGAGNAVGQVFKSEEIKPWQRNILAEDSMQLVPDVMDAYYNIICYLEKVEIITAVRTNNTVRNF